MVHMMHPVPPMMMHPQMGAMHPMSGYGPYGVHPQPPMGGMQPMGSTLGSYPQPKPPVPKTPIVVVHSASGHHPHIHTEMVDDKEATRLKKHPHIHSGPKHATSEE